MASLFQVKHQWNYGYSKIKHLTTKFEHKLWTGRGFNKKKEKQATTTYNWSTLRAATWNTHVSPSILQCIHLAEVSTIWDENLYTGPIKTLQRLQKPYIIFYIVQFWNFISLLFNWVLYYMQHMHFSLAFLQVRLSHLMDSIFQLNKRLFF
jgi:hypothetical protein